MWFVTEKLLGKGAYGNVFLAENVETNEFAAAKIIRTEKLKGNNIDIQNEINLHQSFQHENIIRFYGYEQKNSIYHLYLEYADGGELFDKIESTGGIPEYFAQNYFIQVVCGMAYLHSLGVAHRDLQPENLLIANYNILKICDFGLATFFRNQTTKDEQILTTYYGTRPYVSPEVHTTLK